MGNKCFWKPLDSVARTYGSGMFEVCEGKQIEMNLGGWGEQTILLFSWVF